MGWPFLNVFGKGDAAYYFLCSFYACSLSCIDEE